MAAEVVNVSLDSEESEEGQQLVEGGSPTPSLVSKTELEKLYLAEGDDGDDTHTQALFGTPSTKKSKCSRSHTGRAPKRTQIPSAARAVHALQLDRTGTTKIVPIQTPKVLLTFALTDTSPRSLLDRQQWAHGSMASGGCQFEVRHSHSASQDKN